MKSKNTSTRKASVSAILARLLQRSLGVVSVAAPSASLAVKPRNVSRRRSTIALETLEPRLLLSGDPVTSSASGIFNVAFGGTDDAIGIHLVSSSSANGGAIVDLSYFDNGSVLKHLTLGDATNGVLGLSIDGGGGNDSFTTDSLGLPLTIHGGAGTDTLTAANVDAAWAITGANAGTAAGTGAFDGIEKLVGGNRADTLDYSGFAAGVSVDLGAGTATGFSGISGFENVIGSAHADTIVGDANANLLTGGGGANTLSGGGGTDTVVEAADANFTLNAASLLFGGASDSLVGIEQATLTGGAAANIFDMTGSTLVSAILAGGAGNDTYAFSASQSGSFFIDETVGGIDTLDLSVSATNVEIDLSKIAAQTVGGSLSLTLSTCSRTCVPGPARTRSPATNSTTSSLPAVATMRWTAGSATTPTCSTTTGARTR